MKAFILKSNTRLYFKKNILIIGDRIISLIEDDIKTLKHLRYRPLTKKEVNKIFEASLKEMLVGVSLRKKWLALPPKRNFDYERTKKSIAQACFIKSKTKFKIVWESDVWEMPPGEYYFEGYIPRKVLGADKLYYCRMRSLNETRDKWIINRLSENQVSSVLELGCGKQPRLMDKIQKLHRIKSYIGIDLLAPNLEKNNFKTIRGDFFEYLKVADANTALVAEEVIEHLPENKLVEIFHGFGTTFPKVVLMTTPNGSFTKLLGLERRHPDHHFEWSKKELIRWTKMIEMKFNCNAIIHEIGSKRGKQCPSWGIEIIF